MLVSQPWKKKNGSHAVMEVEISELWTAWLVLYLRCSKRIETKTLKTLISLGTLHLRLEKQFLYIPLRNGIFFLSYTLTMYSYASFFGVLAAWFGERPDFYHRPRKHIEEGYSLKQQTKLFGGAEWQQNKPPGLEQWPPLHEPENSGWVRAEALFSLPALFLTWDPR